MNKGINYKKGYVNEILQLLHMVGIIPYRCLRLLGGETKMYQRACQSLNESGDVVIDRKGGEKHVRLVNHAINAKRYKDTIAEVYYNHYETEAYKAPMRLGDKKEATQRKQILDCAAQIMMYASGIDMTPDKKDLRKNGEMIERDDLIYYDSKEVKRIQAYHDKVIKEKETDGTYSRKLQNSRISGLLISPGGIYGVYNIGSQMIEWKRTGELKMANYIMQLIRKKNSEEVSQEKKECIIICRIPKLYVKIMSLDYKNNNMNGQKSKTLLNIDYAYHKMYAVPEDKNGIIQLKIMTKEGWRGKILNSLFNRKEREDANFVSVACDAYDSEKDIYKLAYCIPDMVKLKSFVARAGLEEEKKKFQIYCFTYQLPVITELVKQSATIYKVDLAEYAKNIFGIEE